VSGLLHHVMASLTAPYRMLMYGACNQSMMFTLTRSPIRKTITHSLRTVCKRTYVPLALVPDLYETQDSHINY
jgi:hypothetical protein